MDDDKRRRQILAGVALVVAGGLLMLEQVLRWPALEPGRLWPIILIGLGGNNLLRGRSLGNGKAGWGLTMMLVGGVLLLDTQKILFLRQSWPAFIVIYGLGLLLNNRWGARPGREVRDGD
jgi:hypothetical protein